MAAAAVLLLVPAASVAQPPPNPKAAAQHGPAAPHTARKSAAGDFDVVGWLSLTPAANSLIRAPNQSAGVDLTARDDDTFITVYARRKKYPDLDQRPITGYAPGSDAGATPDFDHVRYLPPTHCSNGAYSTVGGQSANGQDLMGFLGSGTDC